MEYSIKYTNLQATASAADLSSPRCFDDKMLERFADAIVALGIRDSNFACLQAWIFEGDALKTFARFQAGFLSSEDFHRIPCKLAICQIWDALPNPGIPKQQVGQLYLMIGVVRHKTGGLQRSAYSIAH